MTTLITYKSTDAAPARRCDARCHNALLPKCTCICQGINHGVGIDQAIANTQEHAQLLSDAQEAGDFIINPATYQLSLGGKSW